MIAFMSISRSRPPETLLDEQAGPLLMQKPKKGRKDFEIEIRRIKALFASEDGNTVPGGQVRVVQGVDAEVAHEGDTGSGEGQAAEATNRRRQAASVFNSVERVQPQENRFFYEL